MQRFAILFALILTPACVTLTPGAEKVDFYGADYDVPEGCEEGKTLKAMPTTPLLTGGLVGRDESRVIIRNQAARKGYDFVVETGVNLQTGLVTAVGYTCEAH
jgi:hypothetical protein